MRVRKNPTKTPINIKIQDDGVHAEFRSDELTEADKRLLTSIQKDKKRSIQKGESIGDFTYIAIDDLKYEIVEEILKKYGKYSRDDLVPVLILPSRNIHLSYTKLINDHFTKVKAYLADMPNTTVANKIKNAMEKYLMLHNTVEEIFASVESISNYYNEFAQQLLVVQMNTRECANLCLAFSQGNPVTQEQIDEKLVNMETETKKLMQMKKESVQKGLSTFPSYEHLIQQLNEIKSMLERIPQPEDSNNLKHWDKARYHYSILEYYVKNTLQFIYQAICNKQECTATFFETAKKQFVEISEMAEDILDEFPDNSDEQNVRPTASSGQVCIPPRVTQQQNPQASYANTAHLRQFKCAPPPTQSQSITPVISLGMQRHSPPPSLTRK